MTKLDNIESILNEKFKDNSGILIETDKDKNGQKFEMRRTIVSNQLQYLSYKYDSKIDVFPFFKTNVSGVKKMCDYVLFIEENQNLHIFLVELKKGAESANKQLLSGESFANFIIETVRRINPETQIDTKKTYFRKIRICESKSKKQTLKMEIVEQKNGIIDHIHPNCFYLKNYIAY